jgi:hypothetical protein
MSASIRVLDAIAFCCYRNLLLIVLAGNNGWY